jgi:hypothetical protein
MAPPFLTSALDGGELSDYSLATLLPGETAPSTRHTGGRVEPRAGLDTVK